MEQPGGASSVGEQRGCRRPGCGLGPGRGLVLPLQPQARGLAGQRKRSAGTGVKLVGRGGRLPLPPDGSVVMRMRTPNPHSLIGSKSTVLTGWNTATLIPWLIKLRCVVFFWKHVLLGVSDINV